MQYSNSIFVVSIVIYNCGLELSKAARSLNLNTLLSDDGNISVSVTLYITLYVTLYVSLYVTLYVTLSEFIFYHINHFGSLRIHVFSCYLHYIHITSHISEGSYC